MTWHVDPATARRYADRDLDGISSASVEAHVIDCALCRDVMNRAVDMPILDAIWLDIDAAIDQPHVSWTQRALRRLGLDDTSARLLVGTVASRRSYLLAVVLSLALAVVATLQSDGSVFTVFLVVAPVGPLLATAAAFGRWSDVAFELMGTVPVTALRLLLLRVIAAVVPSLALTALSVPWSLDRGWYAVAWLAPSLALSGAVVALSTWVPAESAAIAVAAAWLSVPFVARAETGSALDWLVGRVQVASVVAVAIAVVVTISRRDTLDYREH